MKKCLICTLINYMQIDELKIEELSADERTKRRLKNYLQIEEPFANWRIVCRMKNYSIGRLKNDMQIKELSTDWQNYLQIE